MTRAYHLGPWALVQTKLLNSIVRGTTSLQVCIMAREAGAKKVYFAASSPPVTYAAL